MAYVTVPKDLTHVKSKVLFGLTKRQLVCFGGALLTGGPLYFLARNYLSNSAAALLMIFAMLPGLLFALFERHGQPLEVVIQQMIQCCFIRPKERPYQTNNACVFQGNLRYPRREPLRYLCGQFHHATLRRPDLLHKPQLEILARTFLQLWAFTVTPERILYGKKTFPH